MFQYNFVCKHFVSKNSVCSKRNLVYQDFSKTNVVIKNYFLSKIYCLSKYFFKLKIKFQSFINLKIIFHNTVHCKIMCIWNVVGRFQSYCHLHLPILPEPRILKTEKANFPLYILLVKLGPLSF